MSAAVDSQQVLLEAQDICVTRQGKCILDSVAIRIGAHDFITIIGPNGAGKSMLLKCLVGFHQPDRGRISRQPGLRIGYVPQHMVPDPALPITVRRFLTLRKRADEESVRRIAQETHIDGILDTPFAVLSGGELQRTLLARSLLDDPQLLVLDEPAQNLDISGQLSFYRLLERLYEQRSLGILMVSHDLHMVMASTQQVVCLYHHVCCSGEPHAVTQDPEFISLFGHDMAKMMAVYQHSHSHEHG